MLTVLNAGGLGLIPDQGKLKKVGKTTRPFRYDLNQTPYGYTVEVAQTHGVDPTEAGVLTPALIAFYLEVLLRMAL